MPRPHPTASQPSGGRAWLARQPPPTSLLLLLSVLLLLLLQCTAARGAVALAPDAPSAAAPARRPPKISEDEDHALGTQYRCPACAAAFWEIDHALRTAETARARSPSKVAAGAPLVEHEYLEVLERACEYHKQAPLYTYAIRVNSSGVNTLTGRGIHPPEPQASFYRGRVPNWLGDKCLQMIGDIGEDEMYQMSRTLPRHAWFDAACGKECAAHGTYYLMPREGEYEASSPEQPTGETGTQEKKTKKTKQKKQKTKKKRSQKKRQSKTGKSGERRRQGDVAPAGSPTDEL